jgi:hypothetical protein
MNFINNSAEIAFRMRKKMAKSSYLQDRACHVLVVDPWGNGAVSGIASVLTMLSVTT